MGMLDRIKKRSYEGFKEFVLNVESSNGANRQQIFLSGILDDPVFMTFVMKNVRSFEDLLNLSSDDIQTVLMHDQQLFGIFAKCIYGMDEGELAKLGSSLPKLFSKIKDELQYLKDVTPGEKEAARQFMLKMFRKLQMQDRIEGFKWMLPPQDIFYPKSYSEGSAQIFFESGILAAQGEIIKGKRSGVWQHYWDNSKLLAEGEYADGYKTGLWTFYYSNGSVKAKGKYKADMKHGTWEEWDRSGVVNVSEYFEGAKKE